MRGGSPLSHSPSKQRVNSAYQRSPYYNVPLGMGGIYRFDRGLVQVVYWYALVYCMSLHSVWLDKAWYVSYQQLAGTLVRIGKTNHGAYILLLISTFLLSLERVRYCSPSLGGFRGNFQFRRTQSNLNTILGESIFLKSS